MAKAKKTIAPKAEQKDTGVVLGHVQIGKLATAVTDAQEAQNSLGGLLAKIGSVGMSVANGKPLALETIDAVVRRVMGTKQNRALSPRNRDNVASRIKTMLRVYMHLPEIERKIRSGCDGRAQWHDVYSAAAKIRAGASLADAVRMVVRGIKRNPRSTGKTTDKTRITNALNVILRKAGDSEFARELRKLAAKHKFAVKAPE